MLSDEQAMGLGLWVVAAGFEWRPGMEIGGWDPLTGSWWPDLRHPGALGHLRYQASRLWGVPIWTRPDRLDRWWALSAPWDTVHCEQKGPCEEAALAAAFVVGHERLLVVGGYAFPTLHQEIVRLFPGWPS